MSAAEITTPTYRLPRRYAILAALVSGRKSRKPQPESAASGNSWRNKKQLPGHGGVLDDNPAKELGGKGKAEDLRADLASVRPIQ
jgi:hypothetical protein